MPQDGRIQAADVTVMVRSAAEYLFFLCRNEQLFTPRAAVDFRVCTVEYWYDCHTNDDRLHPLSLRGRIHAASYPVCAVHADAVSNSTHLLLLL